MGKLLFSGLPMGLCRDRPPGRSVRKFDLDGQIFCYFSQRGIKNVPLRGRAVEDAGPYIGRANNRVTNNLPHGHLKKANKKRHRFRWRKLVAWVDQMARSTLLERRHLVQAYTWHGVPLTTALTRLTLGFQVRLERLWEWETLMPKVTPLPQKSHLAIHCTSFSKMKS